MDNFLTESQTLRLCVRRHTEDAQISRPETQRMLESMLVAEGEHDVEFAR